MPYKVYKMMDDRRNHTCGFSIPNGGWYHVVDMTFENYDQLSNISKRANYSVDYVEGETGMFDPDGNAVDPQSVVIDSVLKLVTDYKKLKGGQVEHKTSERDDMIAACRRRGVPVDGRWSTQRIKEAFETATQRREGTLVVG